MANKIPIAIADVELQISTAISVGDTSFSVSSANDDDGNALPAGYYCFTLDNGTSQKEYLVGQLNGTDITSVESINRQGTTTSGAARKHRVGAPCIITNFATIRIVEQILRGQEDLDGASPIGYDSEPTLSSRPDLATVGYVLDTVSGGTVAFDSQIITGNAGETVADGDLVYFKTSDQEWYKTDADTAATVEGVQIGIAQGAGTDGAGISGGIQISGTYTTTGLTAGSIYYAGNTAGAISATAGTTKQAIGIALSTTKLLLIPRNPQNTTTRQEDALAGGGDFGTPSASNKFLTEDWTASASGAPVVETFTADGTWTKDAGLKYVVVEVVGGGGGGGNVGEDTAGGGAGGYSRKTILASALGATETVTVGSGGAAGSAGSTSSFGSHCSSSGGSAGGIYDSPGGGGTATGGDVNVRGGPGSSTTNVSGGNNEFGSGGSSYFGGGGAGDGGSGASAQAGETNSGGGGSGGAAGGSGIVIVTEYYS